MPKRPTAVFTTPTPADIAELAAKMRQADREEAALSGGHTPLEAARLSVAVSDAAFAARAGGELHCLFGARVHSVLDGEAVAWMLCTDAPGRDPRAFVANCRAGFRALAAALPEAETFFNFVHDRNAAAVRWLEWSGAWFSVSGRDIRAASGAVFRRFEIDAAQAAGRNPLHV